VLADIEGCLNTDEKYIEVLGVQLEYVSLVTLQVLLFSCVSIDKPLLHINLYVIKFLKPTGYVMHEHSTIVRSAHTVLIGFL
jgi:hypothetical protein